MGNEKVKVLLIEDLKAAQLAAYSILRSLGCHVSVASNGLNAFQQLMDHHFDMIFLDIQLPDINGFSFVEMVRDLERKSRMPIIAVTAHSAEDFAREAKRHGFDDSLIKPLTLESVRHTLFKYLPPNKRSFESSPSA